MEMQLDEDQQLTDQTFLSKRNKNNIKQKHISNSLLTAQLSKQLKFFVGRVHCFWKQEIIGRMFGRVVAIIA